MPQNESVSVHERSACLSGVGSIPTSPPPPPVSSHSNPVPAATFPRSGIQFQIPSQSAHRRLHSPTQNLQARSTRFHFFHNLLLTMTNARVRGQSSSGFGCLRSTMCAPHRSIWNFSEAKLSARYETAPTPCTFIIFEPDPINLTYNPDCQMLF
ncbi:uncharacterized protein LAESUDRAFT_544697 [Laetiporus sulphureus 93-53]|uniref:Uncharacterized protein n=1 Tax=Laetiporus sulphureus 93-53 TaxID=1314785 RepID=A0A165FNH3_9APHY|nr:uncharacterized protein LAESUDRAFT_544697 [Laetiporus sulphureus 93-53]KZT09233.1 hypothetical protein LAESUDRAFT_544697 [Laetiporus sulphureus 93-53]